MKLKFITKQQHKPFFLYLPYHSVHTPIQGKRELVERYQQQIERTGRKFNPAYAAMAHSLDENVGRVGHAVHDGIRKPRAVPSRISARTACPTQLARLISQLKAPCQEQQEH